MTTNRRFCDGINRRDLLRIGLAGTIGGAVTLPQLLAAGGKATGGATAKADSVIILFLKGGLSTIDTLDLKPKAPSEFRGEFDPIATNVPGIEVCSHLPALAQQAHRFSLLRSMTHPNSDHGGADHYMLTGYQPAPGFNPGLKPNNQRPAHGAMISRQLGPRGGVPAYVCVPKMHASAGSAYLGSINSPFVVEADPNQPNFSVPDLMPPLTVDSSRLNDRRALSAVVDRFQKDGENELNKSAKQLSTFQQKAFELVTSTETRQAFDIAQESDKLRDAYGRHTLGQSCLLARRLVQAGVRCVTIDHQNWDTHYDNFKVLKNDLLPHLDMALPMLLSDLDDRGILDRTLVIVMGEFGRTPRVNQYAGRDHWGPSNCILLAGGGIKHGLAVGKTNARGERPDGEPTSPEDLAATMHYLLGIDPNEEFYTPEGRPVKVVNGGKVVYGLV